MSRTLQVVFKGKKMGRVALQFASILGDAPGQKVVRIPEKAVMAGGPDKPTTQPTIYLGRSRNTTPLWQALPEAFHAHGVACRMNKTQAIVTATYPDGLNEVEAKAAAETIGNEIRDLIDNNIGLDLAKRMLVHPEIHRSSVRSRRTSPWERTVDLAKEYSGADFAADKWNDWGIRDQYEALLYVYAAARFRKEFLAAFTAD